LVVLSQIYSETSAHNIIKIYSDLTFLSHIV